MPNTCLKRRIDAMNARDLKYKRNAKGIMRVHVAARNSTESSEIYEEDAAATAADAAASFSCSARG